jgi:glycerol-3-phosphate dehydrogenase (NAD(P)+)
VVLYARNEERVAAINSTHRNPKCLSDYEIPATVEATSDVGAALADADVIVLCLPAQTVPEWLSEHRDLIPHSALLCNTAKGLYLKEKRLLSSAINHALGREQPFAVLSGATPRY